MCTEFAKLNRQDNTTARATGHGSANAVNEYAMATEELVAGLTEKHSKQIEELIKANNDAMAKLTAAILDNKIPSTANSGQSNTKSAKQQWAEKWKNATLCPHCNKKHPN